MTKLFIIFCPIFFISVASSIMETMFNYALFVYILSFSILMCVIFVMKRRAISLSDKTKAELKNTYS